MASNRVFLCGLIIFSLTTIGFSAKLSTTFYNKVCPQALSTIKRVVNDAVSQEKRMGASLLRLHFHDCFVNGCDASVLLDPSSTIDSEKNALPNLNSIRGFQVIDNIKSAVDKACGRPVVSCADILAIAARDSVVALGGLRWKVRLGRRDSTTANRAGADADLPSAFSNLQGLIDNFQNKGLNVKDLVALSGAHTIGVAKCRAFRERIYGNSNIDPVFARLRQATCPLTGGDTNHAPFDPTPNIFDTKYFSNLVSKRGLLISDQALFTGHGGATDSLVKTYSKNPFTFGKQFGKSMIKMGNIDPLTGNSGQIRVHCRKVNN